MPARPGSASLNRKHQAPERLRDKDRFQKEEAHGSERICDPAEELENRPSECTTASIKKDSKDKFNKMYHEQE